MHSVFSATILGKYRITYFYCNASGLLQTEPPYWLSEAYGSAIPDADTGLLERNVANQSRLEPILHRIIRNDSQRIVDVGAGYGLLTRLLRDRGFDCYSYDAHCANLFAAGFEAGDHFDADVLLAMEVLEHVEDPKSFLSGLFGKYNCRRIIFSTAVFDDQVPPLDWWYYSFDSGQHITFYQPRTLEILARKLGCFYSRLGSDLHMISNTPLSDLDRALLAGSRLSIAYARYVRLMRRHKTYTWSDHLKIRQQTK
jgi:hypothetical protein